MGWWFHDEIHCVCLISPEGMSKKHSDLELLHIKVRGFIKLFAVFFLLLSFHPREAVSLSESDKPRCAYLSQHRLMCDKYVFSA